MSFAHAMYLQCKYAHVPCLSTVKRNNFSTFRREARRIGCSLTLMFRRTQWECARLRSLGGSEILGSSFVALSGSQLKPLGGFGAVGLGVVYAFGPKFAQAILRLGEAAVGGLRVTRDGAGQIHSHHFAFVEDLPDQEL